MSTLKTENLTKIYKTGATSVVALDHVNLTVNQGEFVAIMGPSGCGKSTLLHLMGGLDRPTEGEVVIGGQNLETMPDDRLTELRRRQIGFIFQSFNLIPVLNAVENAALPLTLDGKKASDAAAAATGWLSRFGLGERLTHYPDQLSAGQQQRVAIARGLIAEPELILADEPTGNLDTRAGDEIAGLLREISRDFGRTIVMVTHDPRIAAYADRIVFLKDGRIVDDTRLDRKDGKHEESVSARLQAMQN